VLVAEQGRVTTGPSRKSEVGVGRRKSEVGSRKSEVGVGSRTSEVGVGSRGGAWCKREDGWRFRPGTWVTLSGGRSGSEVGVRGGFAGPSRKSASEVRAGRRSPKSEVRGRKSELGVRNRSRKSESEVGVRNRGGAFGLQAIARKKPAGVPANRRAASATPSCFFRWKGHASQNAPPHVSGP
jgi:hypothetical protein